MNKIKYFYGEARLFKTRGINDYELRRDANNKFVVILRGTFTLSELRAFTDALEMENEKFEMPESWVE